MAAATRVLKLDRSRAETLRAGLEEAGFEITEVPYATFGAKGEGVNVVHYTSGKLVVQGKDAGEWIGKWIPELGGSNDVPKEALIGADEAGKGDYFGPLVCAAVALTPDIARFLDEVPLRDSKTLSPRDISEAADTLRRVVPFEIVSIGPAKYNELYAKFGNLNSLLAWAHATAIKAVVKKSGVRSVLLDKFCDQRVVERALGPDRKDLDFRMEVRAEAVPAVAAASILARDAFVRGVQRLGREFDVKLPLGAGEPVDRAARTLVASRGRAVLRDVAKLHFKNTQKIP